MNWEAIGAIAESVGAIGVIVTLVYLASQLRSNTKAIEAQMSGDMSSLRTSSELSNALLLLLLFRAKAIVMTI